MEEEEGDGEEFGAELEDVPDAAEIDKLFERFGEREGSLEEIEGDGEGIDEEAVGDMAVMEMEAEEEDVLEEVVSNAAVALMEEEEEEAFVSDSAVVAMEQEEAEAFAGAIADDDADYDEALAAEIERLDEEERAAKEMEAREELAWLVRQDFEREAAAAAAAADEEGEGEEEVDRGGSPQMQVGLSQKVTDLESTQNALEATEAELERIEAKLEETTRKKLKAEEEAKLYKFMIDQAPPTVPALAFALMDAIICSSWRLSVSAGSLAYSTAGKVAAPVQAAASTVTLKADNALMARAPKLAAGLISKRQALSLLIATQYTRLVALLSACILFVQSVYSFITNPPPAYDVGAPITAFIDSFGEVVVGLVGSYKKQVVRAGRKMKGVTSLSFPMTRAVFSRTKKAASDLSDGVEVQSAKLQADIARSKLAKEAAAKEGGDAATEATSRVGRLWAWLTTPLGQA